MDSICFFHMIFVKNVSDDRSSGLQANSMYVEHDQMTHLSKKEGESLTYIHDHHALFC